MQSSSIFRHLLLATVVSGLVLPSSSGCLSARGDDDETSSASGDGDGDGDPTMGDGDGDATTGDGDGDGDSDVTIYDVQQGNVIEGVIQLNDVIVTSPTELDSMGGAGTLYIQEPGGGEYSGIALYLYSEVAAANSLAPGDVLNITAEYTEYFGLSELVVKGLSDITVTGTDAVPAPAVVNAADVATGGPLAENYEGVLIQVENATADTSDGFGGWFLDSGLLLDLGFLFATGSAPTINAGDSFTSITGPLSFGFDEFRILPRTADDLDGQTLTPPTDATIPEIQQGTFPETATEAHQRGRHHGPELQRRRVLRPGPGGRHLLGYPDLRGHRLEHFRRRRRPADHRGLLRGVLRHVPGGRLHGLRDRHRDEPAAGRAGRLPGGHHHRGHALAEDYEACPSRSRM